MDKSSQKCTFELATAKSSGSSITSSAMQPGRLALTSASQLHQEQFFEITNVVRLVIKMKVRTQLIVTELDEC